MQLPTRTKQRTRRKLVTVLAVVAATALSLLVPGTASAASPSPVYAPDRNVADPGMIKDHDDFFGFTSGAISSGSVPIVRGGTASGPWSTVGSAINPDKLPTWVAKSYGVWAPDVWHTSAGYVMYYSAVAKNFGGQRCIGVATASVVTGPYDPLDGPPLVCPGNRHNAEDDVIGRPIADAGVIDPSPFADGSGRRYLLYKTQQKPSSIRMVRLGTGGQHLYSGVESHELLRRSGVIENPMMMQRGSSYVLFASRNVYTDCRYATVWLRSSDRWHFGGVTEHSLMSTKSTAVCGPGGADITPSLTGGHRIFLHGWYCNGRRRCYAPDFDDPSVTKHRALYAAILAWKSDGTTPYVPEFL